jgi:hypothetical protein
MSLAYQASLMLTPGTNFVLVKSVTFGGAVSASTRVDYFSIPRMAKSETVAPGGKVTLRVADTVPNDAGYQWQFNEVNIPGATSSTLVINSAKQTDEGLYRVVLSGYFGTTMSSEIALRIAPVVLWGQTVGLESPVGLSGVTTIAAGSDHILARKSDGTVVAWGNWMDGIMPEATNVPPALSNVVAIAAWDGQNIVAKSDGTVVCFGHNMPPVPAGLSNVIAVACANAVQVALKSDGTVAQWSSKKVADPTANGIEGVIQIAGGNDRWAALTADGSVTLYADDGFGNIVPAAVDGLSGVVRICCGGWQCLAVLGDGTVVAFGGDQTLTSGLNNVVAVASPWSTSYALKNDGSMVSWGYNGNGQGNVPSGLNVSQVVAGNLYGAALVNSSDRTIDFRLTPKLKIDQAPPTVNLQTPKLNGHTIDARMTGVCGDSGPVKHVYYKCYPVDNDPPETYSDVAVTGTIVPSAKNKWTFSAPLTPVPGTNILEVLAEDDWGNQSTAVSRAFVFEVPLAFNLSIAGDGAGRVILAPVSYSGPKVKLQSDAGAASMVASVYLGETYSLTAQATGGASFSNWTGVVQDTASTVWFTADSGMSAQASFIGNRFGKGWKGTYNGLFRAASAVRFETAGALNNLVIGGTGQFTALVGVKGQRYAVAGLFSPTGDTTATVAAATETLTVHMQLDFVNPASGVAAGTVSSSAGWTANLDLRKTGNIFSGPSGRANLVVTTPSGAVATPASYGYVQVNVTSSGQAILTGSLSDGSIVSGQSGVTTGGKVAFYSPLYGGGGMAWGWLPVAGITSNFFNGDLIWIKKPIAGDLKYPAGFTNDFGVAGALLNVAMSAFDGATGTLTLSGGELASAVNFPVQLAVKGNGTVKVVKLGGGPANMLNFTVTPKGIVQGSFGENAGDSSGPSIFGAMLQSQRTVYGYWIGNNGVSGTALLKF